MGYLNETGLAYLWGKIKTHVATQLKNNVAAISSGGTGETTRSHAMNTLMNLGQSFTPPTSNDFDSWAALGTGGEWMQNVWADLPVEGIITQQVFESAWGRDTIFQLAINESGKLFYRYGEDAWDTDWLEVLSVNTGARIKKVWTNASPTSEFKAQTLSSSVLGGALVSKTPIRIEWRPSATGGERFFTDGTVGDDILCNFISGGNANSVPVIRTRNVKLRTTGITFENAYSKTITNSTTYVQNTTSVIPVAIYAVSGWKGV